MNSVATCRRSLSTTEATGDTEVYSALYSLAVSSVSSAVENLIAAYHSVSDTPPR
jgi:hypothetical protein